MKKLTGQTAQTTEEIAAQITRMQAAAGSTVLAIDAIGMIIGELDGIAAAIAAAGEDQQAFSEEIARLISEASARTDEARSAIAAMSGPSN